MPFETNFGATIEVEGWSEALRRTDLVNVYTERSKIEKGEGAAVLQNY